MKVYVIYLNETEGMILVYANSAERAMELFRTSKASPAIEREIDLKDVKVEIYPTQMVVETDIEGIGEYCISEDL